MVKPQAVVTPLFKIASGFLVIAFCLHAVGFATANWAVQVDSEGLKSRTGLWRSCRIFVNVSESCGITNTTTQEWFVAVRTFEAFGLACLSIDVVITVLLLTVVSNHRLARVDVYICVFSGIFIVLGCGTFTWKTRLDLLGYSCWLCWASSLVLVITVIFLECDHHKKSSARRSEKIRLEMIALEQGHNGYNRNLCVGLISHHPHNHPHFHPHLNPHLHPHLHPLHGVDGHQVTHVGQNASRRDSRITPPPNRTANQHYLFVAW